MLRQAHKLPFLQKRQFSKNINIQFNSKISTELNNDPTYKPIGVVHFKETTLIDPWKNIFNFDKKICKIYNDLTKKSLQQLDDFIIENPSYKITDIKMDFEKYNEYLIINNIYGTLLEKTPNNNS